MENTAKKFNITIDTLAIVSVSVFVAVISIFGVSHAIVNNIANFKIASLAILVLNFGFLLESMEGRNSSKTVWSVVVSLIIVIGFFRFF